MSDDSDVKKTLAEIIENAADRWKTAEHGQTRLDVIREQLDYLPRILSVAQEFRDIPLGRLDEKVLKEEIANHVNTLNVNLKSFWTVPIAQIINAPISPNVPHFQQVIRNYLDLCRYRYWIPYIAMEQLRGAGGLFEKVSQQVTAQTLAAEKLTITKVAEADKLIAEVKQRLEGITVKEFAHDFKETSDEHKARVEVLACSFRDSCHRLDSHFAHPVRSPLAVATEWRERQIERPGTIFL